VWDAYVETVPDVDEKASWRILGFFSSLWVGSPLQTYSVLRIQTQGQSDLLGEGCDPCDTAPEVTCLVPPPVGWGWLCLMPSDPHGPYLMRRPASSGSGLAGRMQ
jgi:hypothetical protein